jgi:hypothetical protein
MEIVVKVGHDRRSWPSAASAAATALPNSEVAKHVPFFPPVFGIDWVVVKGDGASLSLHT